MAVYLCEGATRQVGSLNVVVSDKNKMSPLLHHVKHSPDGFQIGYMNFALL